MTMSFSLHAHQEPLGCPTSLPRPGDRGGSFHVSLHISPTTLVTSSFLLLVATYLRWPLPYSALMQGFQIVLSFFRCVLAVRAGDTSIPASQQPLPKNKKHIEKKAL